MTDRLFDGSELPGEGIPPSDTVDSSEISADDLFGAAPSDAASHAPLERVASSGEEGADRLPEEGTHGGTHYEDPFAGLFGDEYDLVGFEFEEKGTNPSDEGASLPSFSAEETDDSAFAFVPSEDKREDEKDALPAEPASLETAAERYDRAPRRVKRLSLAEILSRRRETMLASRGARAGFCIAALLTVLLAALELLPAVGADITVPLGISRVVGGAALLDLQLLLLIALTAWRSIDIGIRSIFSGHFRSESVLVSALVLCIIYDIYLFAAGIVSPTLTALPVAVALVASVYVEGEELSVRTALLALLTHRSGVSAAETVGRGRNLTVRISAVRHVDGYDEKISEVREGSRSRFLVFSLSLALGVVVAYLSRKGGMPICDALAAGLNAVLLASPFAMLLSRRLILVALQSALLRRRTGLVSEKSAFATAEAKTFSLDDVEAFGEEDIRLRLVKVFHDYHLDEAIGILTGMFRTLGGPLAAVLAKTGGDACAASEVKILAIEDDGVVANKLTSAIAVGSASFMERNHISLACDDEADRSVSGDRTTVMYFAIDGDIKAKFFFEYALSRSFERCAEGLHKAGIRIELRTTDPNLTSEYLTRISCLPARALFVKTLTVEETEHKAAIADRVTAGLFTLERPGTLLDARLAFRRYTMARRTLAVGKVLEFMVGSALAAVFAVAARGAFTPVYVSALYHIATILFTVYMTERFRRHLAEGEKTVSQRQRPTKRTAPRA